MIRRKWIVCAVLATVLANIGCVTPCHKGYKRSLECAAENELPTVCRNRVHVFMVHGLTPSTDSGLNALRLKLGDSGFAKIGLGEVCHAYWVRSEIDCIRKNDPDARFVLLGYDVGAATAVSLARDLTAKGVPVDALVLLDPMCCPQEPSGVYTLLIASGKSTSCAPHSARIVVPDASHFGLPAHPTTVATVTELLKDIATRNCQPENEPAPDWTYPHAPAVRSEVKGKIGGDWDFLADRPGTAPPIGTHAVAQPASVPGPNSAGPVTLKR